MEWGGYFSGPQAKYGNAPRYLVENKHIYYLFTFSLTMTCPLLTFTLFPSSLNTKEIHMTVIFLLETVWVEMSS